RAHSSAHRVSPGEGLADDLAGVVPDLVRIVLDPARVGKMLPVSFLRRGDRCSAVVEQHGPRARSSLVDGENELPLLAHAHARSTESRLSSLTRVCPLRPRVRSNSATMLRSTSPTPRSPAMLRP